MDLWQVAGEISKRLTRIFLRDKDGKRPFAGGEDLIQQRSTLARPHSLLRIFSR